MRLTQNTCDVQLSGFWIMIGLFGALGDLFGSLVEKAGLSMAYRIGSLFVALSSILLVAFPTHSPDCSYALIVI